jgi:hypothetical protein
MPTVSDQPQESELMELDPKRLCFQKPGEIKSVNSTEITSLFFGILILADFISLLN